MYQTSPAKISYSSSFAISDLKLSNFDKRYEVRVSSLMSKRKTPVCNFRVSVSIRVIFRLG